MATLATLLDVETEVETSLDALLSAAPYSLAAIGSDTNAYLTTPRVQCIAEVKKWGPHCYRVASGAYAGRLLYDEFQVQVTVSLVYQPHHAHGPAAIRGAFRAALTDTTRFKAAFAVRDYLKIIGDSLRQIDGARLIENEEKTEEITTVMQFIAVLNPVQLEAAS
jgi:hypothetical protein